MVGCERCGGVVGLSQVGLGKSGVGYMLWCGGMGWGAVEYGVVW